MTFTITFEDVVEYVLKAGGVAIIIGSIWICINWYKQYKFEEEHVCTVSHIELIPAHWAGKVMIAEHYEKVCDTWVDKFIPNPAANPSASK